MNLVLIICATIFLRRGDTFAIPRLPASVITVRWTARTSSCRASTRTGIRAGETLVCCGCMSRSMLRPQCSFTGFVVFRRGRKSRRRKEMEFVQTTTNKRIPDLDRGRSFLCYTLWLKTPVLFSSPTVDFGSSHMSVPQMFKTYAGPSSSSTALPLQQEYCPYVYKNIQTSPSKSLDNLGSVAMVAL